MTQLNRECNNSRQKLDANQLPGWKSIIPQILHKKHKTAATNNTINKSDDGKQLYTKRAQFSSQALIQAARL